MVTSRDSVRTQLTNQGIDATLVEEAMENTGSNDLEILLDYITERLEKGGKDERAKKKLMLEEDRIKREQERMYLYMLREQIKADRTEAVREKERGIEMLAGQSDIVKSAEIKEDESAIEVHNIEIGIVYTYSIDKNENIETMLEMVEKSMAVGDVEVFDGDVLVEDDRRTVEEHGFYPFANLIAKMVVCEINWIW